MNSRRRVNSDVRHRGYTVGPSALIILLFFLAPGQSPKTANAPDSIPTVPYCDLVRNPEMYADRLVRVHATWVYGFEITALYDAACLDRDNRAWFETLDEDKLCPASKHNFNKLKKEGFAKADVTVVGKLYSGRRFGHENGYNFKFEVTCLESAKQIPFNVP